MDDLADKFNKGTHPHYLEVKNRWEILQNKMDTANKILQSSYNTETFSRSLEVSTFLIIS